MELNNITTFVKNIKNNGEFSTKVITATTPTWKSVVNNPYVITRKEGRKIVERIERVRKITYYNNGCMIGGNYVNQVKNQIAKIDGDVEEWVSQPMNGTEWILFPYIMQKLSNNEQKYIRFTKRHNAPLPHVIYMLDNHIVTDKNIINDIKSWLKPHTESAKQAEVGLNGENEVVPFNVKIENVLYVSQSGNEIGEKALIDLFNTK